MGGAAGAAAWLASSLISYAMQPRQAAVDGTDYALLAQTQRETEAQAEAVKQKKEEARKREALRQQQLAGRDVLTGDTGSAPIGAKEQILG